MEKVDLRQTGMQMTQQRRNGSRSAVSLLDKILYGIGNFPIGISIQVVGAYLVFFSTTILHLSGTVVGLIVSIGIIWDAVTDPVMGYISDHTNSRRFGRRHLYLFIGAISMAAVNFFIWEVKAGGSEAFKFSILLVLILLMKTTMTIYTTPYTALGAEMSTDYDERTSIQSIKTVFFLLGLAFVTVFGLFVIFAPTTDYPIGQLNPEAYPRIGLWTSILIVIFGLASYAATKKYIPILRATQKQSKEPFHIKSLFSGMLRVFRNKSFRSVGLTYMFNNMASAIVSNIGLHVFTFTFALDSQKVAVVVGVQFAVSIICQPLWTIFSRKIDKKNSLRLALSISILASLVFGVLVLFKSVVTDNFLLFLPFSVLAGFGLGGMFTLPLSMMADVIDVDELYSGERSEGTYFGSFTLFYKFSQSITLVGVGVFLDLVRFDSNRTTQLHSTVVSMGLFFAIGSLFAFVMAFIAVSFFDLNRQKIAAVQKELQERAERENV